MMIIPIEDLKQMGKSGIWDKIFLVIGLAMFGTYIMVIFYWGILADWVQSMCRSRRGN